MKQIKSYGSWQSPITASKVASGTIRLSDIQVEDESVFWIESRPSEEGRNVIVQMDDQEQKKDLIPRDFNARSRVHEYGGGSYLVHGDTVYFTNFSDQCIYQTSPGKEPAPITPENKARYADFTYDNDNERLITVCEDHSSENTVENSLVSLSINDPRDAQILTRGHDFYSSPKLSPDGEKITWLTWDHPNMPWDNTELHVGHYTGNGTVGEENVISAVKSESITQPRWSPDGTLFYISDRNGWWNIYRWSNGNTKQVTDQNVEFAVPQWVFSVSTYDFLSPNTLICAYTENGRWSLGEVDIKTSKLIELKTPYTVISSVNAQNHDAFFIGGAPNKPQGIRSLNLKSTKITTIKRSTSLHVDKDYLSTPKVIEFPTESGFNAHGFYYPPTNKEVKGPEDELPPLIVISHGGPTSATNDSLSFNVQYWTSRGFAVFDVNYRGSTGFGRRFRRLLYNNWGLFDVEDCAAGAEFLAEKGWADQDRLIIRGGSAGGYTTLAALTFENTFNAGASYFGVSDPASLTEHTHKFESRYLDNLIGPYPEDKDLYVERSPLDHAEDLSCPVIFLQGEEDRVVPPKQAESMYKSLKTRGIPTAYLLFPDEQHGFRQEQHIKWAQEAELYFYSQIFDFELSEEIDPVSIANMDKAV